MHSGFGEIIEQVSKMLAGRINPHPPMWWFKTSIFLIVVGNKSI